MNKILALACPLLLFFAPPSARAEWLLATSETHILAGGEFGVTVVRSAGPSAEPLPESLQVRLTVEDRTILLTLTAAAGAPAAAQTAGAVRRDYRGKLPDSVVGPVMLEVADRPSSRLLLMAQQALQEAAPDALARMRGRDRDRIADAALPPRTPALSGHEPMYFLVGTRESTTARFQLSFKYRLFDDEGVAVGVLPFLSGLHLAYTQTSLWDLESNSAPFRDTSYRPSFLYQWEGDGRVGQHPRWKVQAGLEHESNGRDGERSRSINTAFVRPEWRFALDENWYFGVAPKIFGYLSKKDNPDISTYRGYANLRLLLGKDDGWLWAADIRRGKAGFGSVQIDASYPLRRPFFADTGGFIYAQYFNGYGETLLDYDVRRTPQFRIGFAIVR